MPDQPIASNLSLLERLDGLVRSRLTDDQTDLAVRFARLYYAQVPLEALEERDLQDLYGAALSHLGFARRRRPGELLLRVYNPTLEEDGWECPHTVVDLVCDDMPFLVDSVRMEINRHDLQVLRVNHPLFNLRRDADGCLLEVLDRKASPKGKGRSREAVMHLELVRLSNRKRLEALETDLRRVLADTQRSVQDWGPMRDALAAVVEEIGANPPPLAPDEVAESVAFLRWMADHHFTFLGYRVYELSGAGEQEALRVVQGTGLGILRGEPEAGESQAFACLPPELRARARAPAVLVLTKANSRATVHRPVNLDYVGVKRFDAEGRVCGEHRFLGLYGSRAYSCLPEEIPVLRRKLTRVLERADLEPDGHSAKALRHILETYPRDELFQITEDDLYRIATGILQLGEHQRPRMFLRQDLYGRFIVCLVYAPRERYDTQVRKRMQRILRDAFNGTEVEFTVSLSESALARILFTVRTRPGAIPEYNAREIESRLVDAIQSWQDHLQTALLEHLGEERGNALFQVYGEAFPAAYRDDFSARTGVRDIERMERLGPEQELRMSLYRPIEAEPGHLRFKVFRLGRTLPLSQALPMLENMGVQVEDERPYRVERNDGAPVWVHDFGLSYGGGEAPDTGDVRVLFQDAFARVWQGRMEDDGFNRLVLKARLDWRQISLVRAYAKYLRQTGTAFSQAYMEEAAAANPDIAQSLVELFEVRFDPRKRKNSPQRATRLVTRILEALDAVQSLDQDRILRSFLAAVQATLRTNWYQRGADGEPKELIALKLNPAELPELPEPRPAFEIFVYSPRVEGVHLRGGKVARGGLRWSDRREDFRTEVLGLMKAQMVKNAVIVPVGAKGGFVVKRPPTERGALRDEVVACYRQFIGALLDLTDNLVGGHCQPPPDLIRFDGDDPYLVVAADKGTATFSDIANEVAAGYGFWLGDAFASGGGTGYDHKKMGITARGAWECVRQHFQALGINPDRDPFSVVGIGDMSGDVFGNGMLLSRNIRLVAAFDHRHLFIDPDPDPVASFRERERLFALPGSSWADYDPTLISEGGGVYPRGLKSIRLSPQARAALGLQGESLTPTDLIRAVLRAPVDLLWNGGIGTYVKSSEERDADVGDRGNDAVRVNARELRCRVVGEGGNLGLTQPARIELARRGVRVDSDFIHNAGGVNCSDHEVNIKILLDQVVAEGDLTLKQRNRLLEEMTEEVARLVLQDSYWQGRAIGLDEARAPALLAEHARFMRRLEQRGELHRALESLPDEEALRKRQKAGQGLTRPELALLVSYAKHTLFQEILGSDLPEDPCLAPELEHYFPTPLRERFRERIHGHRLRREILASSVANRLVNRLGSTFAFRLQEELGVSAADLVRGYLAIWEVFGLRGLWSDVAALNGTVADEVQVRVLSAAGRLVARLCRWLLLRRDGRIQVAALIDRYREPVGRLASDLWELVDPDRRAAFEEDAAPLVEAGVPEALARRVAGLDALYSALDLVEVAEAGAVDVADAARVYFSLGAALELDWLAERLAALPSQDRWHAGARAAHRDDLFAHHRSLCIAVLAGGMAGASAETRLETWRHQNHAAVERCLGLLTDLKAQKDPDLAMLSVALRAVQSLARAAAPGNGHRDDAS